MNSVEEFETDIQKEFKKTHGSYSTAPYLHWCYEWDEMPLDSSCIEFFCCGCYTEKDDVFVALRKFQQEELERLNNESSV